MNLMTRGIALSIQDLGELAVVNCANPIVSFQTIFEYGIVFDSEPSRDEAQALSELFKSTFKDLIDTYCDPLEDRKLRSSN
jgi:hypothetical protein